MKMSDMPFKIYAYWIEKLDSLAEDAWWNNRVIANTHGAKKHPKQETFEYINKSSLLEKIDGLEPVGTTAKIVRHEGFKEALEAVKELITQKPSNSTTG
jgi:hypothetical protein